MIDNNKSEIIGQLFINEFKALVNKYNNMDKETISVIERIDKDIDNKYLKEYIFENNNKLQEIVDKYKNTNDLNIDKIIFFAWHNLYLEEIDISYSNRCFNELICNKYTENEGYIIYRNCNDLKDYTRDKLDYMLEDEYHLDRLFDKDTIIDMWLNSTTKKELLENIILDYEIEELLDIHPEYAFTLMDGTEYVFAYK
ncbi:hypothetical protein [Intestinibacter sp.]